MPPVEEIVPVSASQKLQLSLVMAFPKNGTSSCFALLSETFVSCQIILKLFCTFAATLGAHFMVIVQVTLPRNSRPLQLFSKEKPSGAASSKSTEIILISRRPFVPIVNTLVASLPITTCPIFTGFGIIVIGRTFSSESSNSISASLLFSSENPKSLSAVIVFSIS